MAIVAIAENNVHCTVHRFSVERVETGMFWVFNPHPFQISNSLCGWVVDKLCSGTTLYIYQSKNTEYINSESQFLTDLFISHKSFPVKVKINMIIIQYRKVIIATVYYWTFICLEHYIFGKTCRQAPFWEIKRTLKSCYDETCIFSTGYIIKHKQVVCMKKVLFTIFK